MSPRSALQDFEVRNPATGHVIGTYPEHSTESVNSVVSRGLEIAPRWREAGFDERQRVLDAWRSRITAGRDELAQVIHEEMGKPLSDAKLEIVMALEHLKWAASHAKEVLGRRRVPSSLMTINHTATVEYQPFGVVGIIGPWNYPVFTPLSSISFALAAGNAVVFKPSEYTPGVGIWLANAFGDVAPIPSVLQVITGGAETGAALCRSGVGKIGFTGSTATGKSVMAACAETLTPVLMECGGKDALIVDEDADIKAAADAAAWGGLSNAGQTCLGVENVFVHEKVYDSFVTELVGQASKVHAGGPGSPIGPIAMEKQVEIIRNHISDAIDRGATPLLGGLDSVEGRYVQPTILANVPADSIAMTEETFGPVLTVTRVADMDEAVRRANAGDYGLGCTVFSRRHGRSIADRIRSGNASINAFVTHGTIPWLPLGGVGASGFGRVHGPDGLKEFTYARAVTEQKVAFPLPITSFRRTETVDRIVDALTQVLHGKVF